MERFEFKENDIIGEETLDVISKANKFNKWMYETIKPYCNGNILEIGSGVGNISQFFIDEGFPTMLTDIRTGYCERLKKKFGNKTNLLGVETIDLLDPDFENKFKRYLNSFDVVIALNVFEHIQDEAIALNNCRQLLKNDGCMIILVPSYQSIYNGFDKALGHYRRYNKRTLSKLFLENNFHIIHKQYFNFIGIFGWYVSGKLQKNESIPEGQMGLYNLLVPIFKIIDKLIFNTFGLSTIVIGKKQI